MSGEHTSVRISVGPSPRNPRPGTGPHQDSTEAPHAYSPLIDIHDGPEGLMLEADLPGADEQNLSIRLEGNVLTLHARIEPSIPDGARLIHEEYRVGDFYRSFILSDEVDRDRIKAELSQGVLRLTLPRAERALVRRIEIKS